MRFHNDVGQLHLFKKAREFVGFFLGTVLSKIRETTNLGRRGSYAPGSRAVVDALHVRDFEFFQHADILARTCQNCYGVTWWAGRP
jgi:hypothetical protein